MTSSYVCYTFLEAKNFWYSIKTKNDTHTDGKEVMAWEISCI